MRGLRTMVPSPVPAFWGTHWLFASRPDLHKRPGKVAEAGNQHKLIRSFNWRRQKPKMHWPVQITLASRPLDSCIVQHWRIKPWQSSSAAGPWDKNRQAKMGSRFSIISWKWKGWEGSLSLMESVFFSGVSGVAVGNSMAINSPKIRAKPNFSQNLSLL